MARHFLTGEELTTAELGGLIARAIELKRDRLSSRALEGKSVALVFDKPSTRTRVSFETGVHELGGHPLVLRGGELQLSRGESPRDTALVLSRMVHAVGIRTGAHEPVVELAEHASIPVINMLTHDHHPCQALADLMTLQERFGRLEGLKLAYVGDGNNVVRSLLVAGGLAGVEVAVASPPQLSLPDLEPLSVADAVAGAHALYTDVWVSMGDEGDARQSARCWLPTGWTRPCSRAPATTRSFFTACRPIPATRSPRASCMAIAPPYGTRPRTACIPRRRYSSC